MRMHCTAKYLVLCMYVCMYGKCLKLHSHCILQLYTVQCCYLLADLSSENGDTEGGLLVSERGQALGKVRGQD